MSIVPTNGLHFIVVVRENNIADLSVSVNERMIRFGSCLQQFGFQAASFETRPV